MFTIVPSCFLRVCAFALMLHSWLSIFGWLSSRGSQDVDAGKVTPSFKSEPEPKSTEDVKVVVASTLKKVPPIGFAFTTNPLLTYI